jgi:hypothetical protein
VSNFLAALSTRVAACALPILASVGCDVYDPSLLRGGVSDLGRGGDTSQSGTGGTADEANAGTEDGGVAGGTGVSGGSSGANLGGLTGAGGAVDRGGTGGTSASGGADTGGTMGTGGSSSAGIGGSAGSGGGAGIGGTAGIGGGAGGPPNGGGGGGAGASASGCATLTVPLNGAADKAHFVISLTAPADLSHATISMHLYVRAGSGGSIFNFVQDSGTYHFFGVTPAQRAALSSFSGWSTITWDVGAQADTGATGIVKTSIKNIGIEIGAQPSSSWTDPTIVYVDSVSVTTPTLSFTFDGSSSVDTTPTTTAATGQALWVNSGAMDTTAVGVTLGWQATCP